MLDKNNYEAICKFQNENPQMYDLFIDEHKAMLETTSIACHEIKNQAALISSYFQLMESQNSNLADDVFFNKAKTNISQMLTLLDDISLYRYSFLTNNLHPVKIMDVINYVLKECESNNIKITFKNKVSSKVEPIVYGVDERLQRCLYTVILNAYEACPKKPVKMVLQLDKQSVIIHIEDCGGGFEKDFIKDCKKPFVTSKKHHNGLGLSIATNTCIMHKGDLQIASTLRGSHITITLPLFT